VDIKTKASESHGGSRFYWWLVIVVVSSGVSLGVKFECHGRNLRSELRSADSAHMVKIARGTPHS